MTPEELLAAAAEEPPHSPARTLYVVGAVQEILGKPLVLVGGSAANTYTGEYRPTDIDLIGEDIGADDRAKLTKFGFEGPGVGHRHLRLRLSQDEPPILIEFPPPPLLAEPTEQIELAPGTVVSIISLEDLVLDRLRQATDGTDVTREEALALIVATYESIDWDLVFEHVARERAELPELLEALNSIQRAAKRALRRARKAETDS